MRTAVVLPAPFGPSRASTVPSAAAKPIPLSTRVRPNDLVRPVTAMAAGLMTSPPELSSFPPLVKLSRLLTILTIKITHVISRRWRMSTEDGKGQPGEGQPGQGQPSHGGRRPELIAQTAAEVRAQQIAYDRFHDAVASYLGINRTDLRCLDILDLAGRQTAGKLAAEVGLSSGAVTAMLDRLEKTGYVRRLRDPGDRRRVLVEPAELARERGWEVYQPFEEATVPMFARFTDEQLAVVRDFLRIG